MRRSVPWNQSAVRASSGRCGCASQEWGRPTFQRTYIERAPYNGIVERRHTDSIATVFIRQFHRNFHEYPEQLIVIDSVQVNLLVRRPGRSDS